MNNIIKAPRMALLLGSVLIITLCFLFNSPVTLAWFCFSMAALSAIGNDSIQTLGTFLSSNSKTKWWQLWLFVAGIYCLTIFYGFYIEQDIAFGRLDKIPAVTDISFMQALAPVVLLLLTFFKVPISTTFLILSMFASTKTIEAMMLKSFYAYGIAFIVGALVFSLLFYLPFVKHELSAKAQKRWRVFQWLTTGFLWTSWLMQDTANIIVFLPRGLGFAEACGVAVIGSLALALIFYLRGGRIQSIVTEKQDVTDVRVATMVDLTLTFVLIYFKQMNSIPMSTTWVFLGLLAGRELILTILAKRHNRAMASTYRQTLSLIVKDIGLASIGIVVSIAMVFLARLI